MSKAIGIAVDGNVEWHAPGVVSDYDTLCGYDANDPACSDAGIICGYDANDPGIGTSGTVKSGRGQKITCEQCKAIWQATQALRLRSTDFA